jgi:hypothetical protein
LGRGIFLDAVAVSGDAAMDAGTAAVEPTGAMLAADGMGRFSGLAAAPVDVSAEHGGGAHVHAATTTIASCVRLRLLW